MTNKSFNGLAIITMVRYFKSKEEKAL